MNEAWTGWHLSDFKQNDYSWVRHNSVTNTNYVYVNIPKNASSWMKNNFGGWFYNFRTNKFFDQNLPENLPSMADMKIILENSNPPVYVIILRDPIERWLSGAAQPFFEYLPDDPDFFMNYSDDLIFNTIVFDEHTVPQTMFLKNMDLSRVVWFDCTDNLTDQIVAWSKDKFDIKPKPASDYKENAYKISKLNIPQRLDVDPLKWTMMQCIDALKHRLFSNPEHVKKLKEFYKDDYALRESVKFYGTR
jgi:hypothetical protein